MFSKVQIFSAMLMLSLTSGCGFLNDRPKGKASIQGESLNLSCLQVAPNQLQTLLSGGYTFSAKDQESVREIWTCIDKSLNAFSNHTHGSKSTGYSSDELKQFANRYLPADKPFSNHFTNAIFRMKRAVLGGSLDEITHDEITALRKKLSTFGKMTEPLAGHIATLLNPNGNGIENARHSENEKEAAARQLNIFVMDFAKLLSDSKNTLPWIDLSSFISELEKYTRIANKPTALSYVREQLGIYQYFKLLLVGGDEFAIEGSKWTPIFDAISHFYNALFLSDNNVETLEELSIDVKSTEAEQKYAIYKLNGLLKILKNDPNLESQKIVSNLADRWAKALIMNAVLFPRSQGSLALKPLSTDVTLRKLAGRLMDQMKTIKADLKDPAKVKALTNNVIDFISLSSKLNSQNGVATALSFESLKTYIEELKPLFGDQQDYDTAILSVDLFKSAAPILSGKETDHYLPDDLRDVILKSVDLYLAWRPESKNNIYESIWQSLDVILRKPTLSTAKIEQIQGIISITERLMKALKIDSNLDWQQIQAYVKSGFQLKSLLFGNTDKTIIGYELKTLADLWKPFRTGSEDLAKSLSDLAVLLQNNAFATAPVDKMINAINAFLPKNQSIQSYGLDSKVLGLLKSALVGGKPDTIESKDYAALAKIAANLCARLAPYQDKIGKDFTFGLNSLSLQLAVAVIEGISDSVTGIAYNKLKPLIIEVAKQQKYQIREVTVDNLLRGMSHRIFGRNLTPKPKLATGLLTSTQLRMLIPLLQQIQKDFADIENAFKGVDYDTGVLNRKILNSRLKSADVKEIVRLIPPVLIDKDHLVHVSGFGTRNEFFNFDLSYKMMMKRLLHWLFPAYQVEADAGKASGRLTYSDLVDLLDDINNLVTDLKLTYGVNPSDVTATKRMQTINLFTKNGNGDEYLDINETVEFLTISTGGKVLLDQNIDKLVQSCNVDTKGGTYQFLPYACLSRLFSKPSYFTETYQRVVPEMVRQYNRYSNEDRTAFTESMFVATEAKWKEKSVMSFSDFETFIAIPYYAENIFERLDTDHNQSVDFAEAMAGFPLFCREIKKAAGPKVKGSCIEGEWPGQVQAVYGHLLLKGKPPRGLEPGDTLVMKLKVWNNFRKWNNYWSWVTADPTNRLDQPMKLGRKDLLQIISNLATITTIPDAEGAPAAP